MLDVVLDRFDHHDGVIHHQADGEHQAEKRQGVDGKTEQGKQGKRADQGNRHRQQRDQGRAPALQEQEHHDDDQHQGFNQRFLDFLHALGDGQGRVQGDRVVEVQPGSSP